MRSAPATAALFALALLPPATARAAAPPLHEITANSPARHGSTSRACATSTSAAWKRRPRSLKTRSGRIRAVRWRTGAEPRAAQSRPNRGRAGGGGEGG
jgi:hypothetical protein